MIARAIGAFFVALIALGYLFGNSTSNRELLAYAGAALGVAAIVAFWLRPRRQERDATGVFDERAARRAVRCGVVRTALVAVVWVIFGWTLAFLVSSVWQSIGDRTEHFERVAGYGFFVAHPGFQWSRPSCCNTDLRWTEVSLELEPKAASPLAQPADLKLRLGLLGRPWDDTRSRVADLPPTGVDAAAASRPIRSPRTLHELPSSLVATAVVELKRPLDVSAFAVLVGRHRREEFNPPAIYLQPSGPPGIPESADRFENERVSWPSPSVAGFQAWVKLLRRSDDAILDELGVPPLDVLHRIAEHPRIYGFVVVRATPHELERYLLDPDVSMVKIGDTAISL